MCGAQLRFLPRGRCARKPFCAILNITGKGGRSAAFSIARKGKAAVLLDVSVGDILVLKKNHPCGCNRFSVLRTGLDFKLRCEKCGHEIMVPRVKIEKSVRIVEKQEG